MNCQNSGRKCEGYGIQLVFDVDDPRNHGPINISYNSKGEKKFGFRGRPRMKSRPSTKDNNGKVGKQKTSRQETTFNKNAKIQATALSNNLNADTNLKSEPGLNARTTLYENTDLINMLESCEDWQESSTDESSDKSNDADIADPFQFEDALYDGLDYLLQSHFHKLQSTKAVRPPLKSAKPLENGNPTEGMDSFIEARDQNTKMNQSNEQPDDQTDDQSEMHQQRTSTVPKLESGILLTGSCEKKMLEFQRSSSQDEILMRHFFEKVIYLLDAHPHNPWPEMMIRFCGYELARSCFLSLSSIHMYVDSRGDKFYQKGVQHIDTTMKYLMKYVKSKDDPLSSQQKPAYWAGDLNGPPGEEMSQSTYEATFIVGRVMKNLKKESRKRKRSNFFVILLLLYVHILFAILESGRSGLSRTFFKLFASIVSDKVYCSLLQRISQSQTMICVLSWFDTVSALVSPDYRLPFSKAEWYGSKNEAVSTAKMNGCPGEIFQVLSKICSLRHDVGGCWREGKSEVTEIECNSRFQTLEIELLRYRDYVALNLDGFDASYDERLKGTQCWAVAAYIYLIDICRIHKDYREKIDGLVKEFLAVYRGLNSESPTVTQMVWPILEVGLWCTNVEERQEVMNHLDKLYRTVNMGTIQTIIEIVKKHWQDGVSLDEILAGRRWQGAGIDFLPC